MGAVFPPVVGAVTPTGFPFRMVAYTEVAFPDLVDMIEACPPRAPPRLPLPRPPRADMFPKKVLIESTWS